jgi:erythromycin esterase-like protein
MAMADSTTGRLIDVTRRAARPLTGDRTDFVELIDLVGGARFVMIGEASHGTHEFYETRAEITKRLIEEKGFLAVAAEADWPDAYRVNRYVKGIDDLTGAEAIDALAGFKRFPTWMWRNDVILDFVGWLRERNDDLPANAPKAGFYGMDLYSLNASIDAVITYLEKVDPDAARRARARYACFDHYGEDTQAYGYATSLGLAPSCENEVIRELMELRQRAADYAARDGRLASDEFFFAEQNALVARDAEQYYREMFRGRVSSWNLRDRHMAATLEALANHFEGQGQTARIVVWAHNSHVGDARATEVGQAGELTVGQLMRERYGQAAMSIGFTTHTGTVTAASEWDTPAERKHVRPAMRGSYELLFHDAGIPRFYLPLRDGGDALTALRKPLLERAIGVIYLPETERMSHYFYARLPDQFDAVIHLDETRAVQPLERTVLWQRGEVPETFPSAL